MEKGCSALSAYGRGGGKISFCRGDKVRGRKGRGFTLLAEGKKGRISFPLLTLS